MRNALVYEVTREAYAIEDVRKPMTIGDLKRAIREFDDDDLFIISNDNGYTYGKLTEQSHWEQSDDEEEFKKLW